MKLIISVLLTLTFIVLTVGQAEGKTNDRLTISNNLYLSSVSSNGTYSFRVGDSLQTIQEADRAREIAERKVYQKRSNGQITSSSKYGDSTGNPYPFGWCTWYAAEKKGISRIYGNARDWPVNSDTPQEGAVVVTYESPRGHVAYVTAVDGDNITLSEMNYAGFGVVSTRTVNYHKLPLKGFLI